VQNGNYPNPPAIKRQFRDPNGQWWDKQERRNFGEPIHEDNDILGVFSPEQYTHVTSKKAFLSLGTFVAGFLGFCGLVSMYYPDKPSTPRTFPDGLEKELGGPEAVPVSLDLSWCLDKLLIGENRPAKPARTHGDFFVIICT
jgi:NADH dehydrogenase (ubiquinone) 1 beta subcomplex subunit 8